MKDTEREALIKNAIKAIYGGEYAKAGKCRELTELREAGKITAQEEAEILTEARKRYAEEHASRELFSAAEHLREALDTIDLEGLPISDQAAESLEAIGEYLEMVAKAYQKAAKGKTPTAGQLRRLVATYQAKETKNAYSLELAEGVPAAWHEIDRYTNKDGREMRRLCAVIDLRADDLRTAEKIAGYMPMIEGRKPTPAEAYHAAATKGLHEVANQLRKAGEGPAEA